MGVPLFFVFRSLLFLPLRLLVKVYKDRIILLFIFILGLTKSLRVLIKEILYKTDLKYILGLVG